MAFTNPTLVCTDVDGLVNTGLRCAKPADSAGNVTFTCTKWKLFYPNCGVFNQMCNQHGGAYLPGITVCNQRLY